MSTDRLGLFAHKHRNHTRAFIKLRGHVIPQARFSRTCDRCSVVAATRDLHNVQASQRLDGAWNILPPVVAMP